MKKFSEISWQVTEPEYRADPAYSYSQLAKYERGGFNSLSKISEEVSSSSLLFGSMVDTILTDGMDAFRDRYLVLKLPEISDSLEQITRYLWNTYHDTFEHIEMIPNLILGAVGKEFNYYSADKYTNVRIKNIKEQGASLYEALSLAQDKELVSQEFFDKAIECVEALKTSPNTEWYFAQDSNDGIERFYQLKFKDTYNDIPIRNMADLIIVDHNNKRVIPCDLKTSSHAEWDFPISFIQWSYYIQAQMYWRIIRNNMDTDSDYKDYTLENYRFIVASNNKTPQPLVWEYPDTQKTETLYYGKQSQYVCRNWREILTELAYYLKVTPEFPIGISSINNITEFLNNK